MTETPESDIRNRWIDILIAMHAYNDGCGKHHDESARRSANVFILIYFFLVGVIITNGLNLISLFVSIFLTIFARVGYRLVVAHAGAAGMHYSRNRKIRDQLDSMGGNDGPSLAEIFEKSRKQFSPLFGKEQGYANFMTKWAKVHQLFIAVGSIIVILAFANQYTCLSKTGCFWSKGNETTENLVLPLKDFVRRIIPVP